MFAAAALTRQALATYLGGIALFVLGTVAGDLTDGLGNRDARGARSTRSAARAIALTTQLLDAGRAERAAHRVAGGRCC